MSTTVTASSERRSATPKGSGPYVIVVGDKELSGGDLAVRPRLGEQVEMPLEAFLEKLATETAGKPLRAANTPRSLNRRPIFVG
jgi:threonyl-tRNA synthetase